MAQARTCELPSVEEWELVLLRRRFAPTKTLMKFILKIALVFSFVKVLKFVEISMNFTSAISFFCVKIVRFQGVIERLCR